MRQPGHHVPEAQRSKAAAPRVSVVLPSYNRAHLLEQSMRSVLSQSFRDIELIVVDDGSSEDVEGVVRAVDDARVRYLCHDTNRGSAEARNTGIAAARGAYVAFHDSDDEWLPGKLERQVALLDELGDSVAVCYTGMVKVREGNLRSFTVPHFAPEDADTFVRALGLGVKGIGIGTCLIRRPVFDDVGVFDATFRRWVDLELFIRIARTYRFVCIDEPLVRYVETDDAVSTHFDHLVEAQRRLMKRFAGDLERFPSAMARQHSYMMNAHLKEGDIEAARWHYRNMRAHRRPTLRERLLLTVAGMAPEMYVRLRRSQHTVR